MKATRWTHILLLVTIVLGTMSLVGCTSAPSAPAPAPPASAPAKVAEPTKAPSEPTKAPAPQPTAPKQAAWPAKGKSITLINPFSPGGSVDVSARLLAPDLEKELGVPVQVVNKEGAGSQVGITELARSKPDGYTIGYTVLPSTLTLYLDPERKAVFGRKDLQLLAQHLLEAEAFAVRADSPYKTLKDLVDAAKANPEKVKVAVTGVLGPLHLDALQLEKAAGIKFAIVHFDGAAPSTTALLGGHVDAKFGSLFDFMSRPTEFRVLASLGREPNKFLPGVKTMHELGYEAYGDMSRGLAAPAGLPKEVTDVLEPALKRAIQNEATQKKLAESFLMVQYLGPSEFAQVWDQREASVKSLMQGLGKLK